MNTTLNTNNEAPIVIQPRNTRLNEIRQALESYHAQLNWVIDALIPEDTTLEMPSASQIDLVHHYLPEVLLLRDDMADNFYAALAQLPEQAPENGLEALEKMDPKHFECITRLVAGAFFLDPGVNAKLGYGGQDAIWETPNYDEIVDRIQTVLDRGDVYIHI